MSDHQPGGLGDEEPIETIDVSQQAKTEDPTESVEAAETAAAALAKKKAEEAAMLESMSYLSAAEILNADDLTEEDVPCPEWGGKVRVRALSKQRQQALRKAAAPGGEFDAGLFEIALFVEGVIQPEFDASQMEAVRQKSAKPVDRVTRKVMELSGMAEGAVDEAEATFPDGSEA